MPRVHLFNPENDLALAAGIANYTPPVAAQRLRQACARLPLLYADPGDKLLCDGIDDWQGMQPCPWGWSAAAKHIFEQAGCPAAVLPTDAEIEKMRQLSHRRTASTIAAQLRQKLPHIALAEAAIEVRNIEQVEALISQWGDIYAKMPWSSSGRGVLRLSQASPDRFMRFATDSIRRQGSVMIEKAYEKRLDFARLYRCENGEVSSLGTSVFVTDPHGAYLGNLVAPEAQRLERVAQFASLQDISAIDVCIVDILRVEIAPYYNGILGIDMLVATDGTIDACVELNLRHTMGYVALRLSETAPTPSLFSITLLKTPPFFNYKLQATTQGG